MRIETKQLNIIIVKLFIGRTKSESLEAAGEDDVLEAEKVSDSTEEEEEDEAPRNSRSGAAASGSGAAASGSGGAASGSGAASSGGGGGGGAAAGGGSQSGGGSAVTVSSTTTAAATHLTCTFPDHYCNPTADDLIRKVEDQTITDAAHCKRLCAE